MTDAELRAALEIILNAGFIDAKSQRFDTGWPAGKPKTHSITSTKAKAIDEILALFQAREQKLLTELLGELPEKPKKDDIATIMTTAYEGDNMARAYQLAINQVVSVIERLQNKTNDGGSNGG